MSALEKHRAILDFTLSSLLRRKGKTASLLLVYALMVFVLASALFLTRGLKEEARAILKDSPELLVQRMSAGRHELIPQSYLDAIRDTRGVRDATGRLWGYYFDSVAGANYTVLVPATDPPKEGEIQVGRGMARGRDAYEGDLFPFRAYDGKTLALRITSLLSPDSELVSSDLVLMSEQDFRKLFGMPTGVFTDLALTVRNPKEVSTVAAKIVAALPDTRPIARQEILRTYDSVFDWRGGIMVLALLATVPSFIILAWDKATGLSAEERREIGILKAVGWDTADVLRMKLMEGAVVSVSAFLLGTTAAYFHVYYASGTLFEPMLKGWSMLYPQFQLTPRVDMHVLAILFFLSVVPYTVATVAPAWRAASVDPDGIMRS